MYRVPTYKFFGPHMGVLYGRYDLLDRLRAYKVRPAGNQPPDKFETGAKNHEGLAVTERLGVEESGGMVRVGIAHYNTAAEVDRLLAVVNDLARR